MARLREDARFKAVQPDAFELDGGDVPPPLLGHEEGEHDADEGLELWFDWAFVDFWKNHYCRYSPFFDSGTRMKADRSDTIQRSIAVDPDAVRGTGRKSTSGVVLCVRRQRETDTWQHRWMTARLLRSSCRYEPS